MFGLKADSHPRALKFIKEACETEKVYCLVDEDTCFMVESNNYLDEDDDPSHVGPFWSKSYVAYARKWSEGTEVLEISLQEFLEEVLDYFEENNFIFGLNWNQNGLGIECEAANLKSCFAKAKNGEEITIEDLEPDEDLESDLD